jgi:uncharacterized repeat protein (TIGR01451 family)
MVFTNSAVFISNETPLSQTNTVTNTVSAPELEISKVAEPPSGTTGLSPGDAITYTITVTNTGTQPASNILISDTLDSNVTLVYSNTSPAATSVATSGAVLLATWPTLNIGNSVTLVARVIINSGVPSGTVIANTAYAVADDTVPVVSELVTHTLVNSASLLLVKLSEPPSGSTVTPGQTITYTLAVTNNGTLDATNVVMTDTLDPNVNYVSVNPTTGVSVGNPLVFSIGTITVNTTISYTVVVTVDLAAADGALISNTALLDFDGSPVTLNSNTVVHNVGAVADLEVTKVGSPNPVTVGTPLTYTISITNAGPSTATNATVWDVLPSTGVLTNSVSSSQGSCFYLVFPFSVQCSLGSLASGATANVTINVTPTVAGVITNVVSVGADETDPVTSNDAFTETTTVLPLGPALTINKLANPASGTVVEPGDAITYTVVVANIGDAAAANTVITDPVPLANVNVVTASLSNGGSVSFTDPLVANVGSLNASNSVTLTVVVTVGNVATGTNIVNTGGSAADSVPLVTSLPVTHVVSNTTTIAPIFSIVKSASPAAGSTVTNGDRITYRLVVVNSGGLATNVVITDTIPVSTSYVLGSATTNLGGVSGNAARVVWNVPFFPAGFTLTGTFQADVTTNITTTITNIAQLIGNETALQSSNSITHAVQGGTVTPGSNFIHLPIVLKGFVDRSLSMVWDGLEPVRDRVRNLDGNNALWDDPDGTDDGVFDVMLNPGSEGPLRVVSARLESSEGPTIIWDTTPGSGYPALGIFDGGARLNNSDSSIDQVINTAIQISLYAADEARFPPDTYDYTLTIMFDDGSTLVTTARIPPDGGGGGGDTCAPALLDTVAVGNTPRGVAVDTIRTNRAYVANFGSSSVSVVQNNAVVNTVSGVTTANGAAFDTTNDLLWVTNYSIDLVTSIDPDDTSVRTSYSVGDGPWGVAHNTANNYLYVVNSLDDSVTVLNASTGGVVATLTGSFNNPYHVAVNPVTGKAYVANNGNSTVTVIDGAAVSKVVDVYSSQPYGIAVDETRNLIYVTTVDSHRIAVIGELAGVPDEFLGWAEFNRGFNDPARPVPLREIDINPDIGPVGDGGHLWTTTSVGDGSEANQALLIAKGWPAYFNIPVARDVGVNPGEGAAVDRVADRAYITSGTAPGVLSIYDDNAEVCLEPFNVDDNFGYEIYTVEK